MITDAEIAELNNNRRMYIGLAKHLGANGNAEDVVQEAFLTLVKGKDRYDARNLPALFSYIISSRNIDAIRRQPPAQATDEIPEIQAPPEPSFELSDHLQRALNQLSPFQRTIMIAIAFGRTEPELRAQYNASHGNIVSAVYAARHKLQRILVNYHKEGLLG